MYRPLLPRAVLRGLALVLGLGLLATPASAADVRDGATRGPGHPSTLLDVLDAAVRQGSPGALAQSRTGHRVRDAAVGVADIRTGERPRAPMRFRIGSVTKTFVATAVLQLVAEHRLRLDDTVADVLPGVVDRNGNDGSAITIRMLLNDTSGLYEYTQDPRVEQIAVQDPKHCFTLRELVRFATDHPPAFAPGTSWEYSNTNYSLLAMVVEKITGQTYGARITRRILRPLGLAATSFPGCSPLLPFPRLHGYTKPDPADPAGPEIKDATDYNPSFAAGNGDMISTVGDLDRFDSALLRGGLLPARLLREMLTPTPGSFPNTDTLRYGLGVVIARTPCGVTVYGNAGSIQGYETWMSGTRDGRHTMSFVLNNDWLDPTDTIEQAITAEFCAH
ncbi:D-alanyl-D-alanine carboxypeptidase [Streptomyces humidus]|uniref:D-alanyl-D-alanine carboxypeptidase n=1 Tax=Streptomyces humidus TaxID=52259 RepID=A0A918G1Q7_9ACTN|nr:serine hydrolase domain-containing protein [Streptomyces humidus]GGS14659.1 D-alanyl-D-alanine carboxypeptidase [Streptomyces humidus]